MSCLEKVIDTLETEFGKSFTNVVLWSDGMGTQFRSRFIFQLLAGKMYLNKSLCWFYNEGQHDKVPMDDVGGTIKSHFPKSKDRPDCGPDTQRIF